MNAGPKYEQLIAGKLGALPVPDMEDDIWARVKAQLDLDLPANEGDGGKGPKPPQSPGFLGWELSVLLLALVTVCLLIKSKIPRNTITQPAAVTQPAPPASKPAASPPRQTLITERDRNAPRQGGIPGEAGLPNEDSLLQQELASAPDAAPDTTTLYEPPALTVAPPPTIKDSLPPKKGRGIKLKDDDYRIVPKKENSQ